MTISDQRARPPDNPPPGPEWMPIPGAGYYEASHRGKVRSVDRTIDGRFHKGKELSIRPQNGGPYLLADVRRDDGSKWTSTVHSFVLRAHVPGYPQPGEETLHGPGGEQDNRFPENIQPGTRPQNVAQMAENRPPRVPKPPKVCPRCEREHTGPGRRCHECVVQLGLEAAPPLADGADPERLAVALDYPSAVGLIKLAMSHGGLRMYIDPAVTPGYPPGGYTERLGPRLRRVMKRAGASGRNSDSR